MIEVTPPPQTSEYRPSAIEDMAAELVAQTGRTVLLFYGSKTGDPRFILHPEQAGRYLEVPRS